MARVTAVTAAIVAFVVALSGCSLVSDGEHVFGDVERGVVAQQRLENLTETLRKRDDVVSAQASAVPVYQTASVTVELRENAAPAAIAEVVTLVDDALRSAELQPMKSEFDVKAGNASIRQTNFEQARIDYAAELEYWGALKLAVGPNITFTLGPDRVGALQRILSTDTDATVVTISENFDAIAPLEAPSGVETLWKLPGITGYANSLGPLPDRRVLDVLATMAGLTKLLDSWGELEPPGVSVNLPDPGREQPPRFTFAHFESANQAEADATWQLALAMARKALTSGLPQVMVTVVPWSGEIEDMSNAYRGECLEEFQPANLADRKLVADLVASGVDAEGINAGLCVRFANP